VPVADVEAEVGRDGEQLRFIHPTRQRFLSLCGKVDEHTALGSFRRGLHDRIQAFISIDEHGRGVAGIETHERAMRPIRVEADERNRVVDEVLREKARHERFAYAALSPPIR